MRAPYLRGEVDKRSLVEFLWPMKLQGGRLAEQAELGGG